MLEISAFSFSIPHNLFRDQLEGASLEYWTKELEITTRQWCTLFRDGSSNRATLHPSLTTIYPHNGHFLRMKGQAGLGSGVGGHEGLGLGVRTGQGDDSAALSVWMSFFGVEREGTAEGQSKGLCVPHFDCRLCYTVHGSPRVQRERVIYFVNIMNVGFVFGQSRTRMFSLISPHGPKGGLLFWTYENHGINHSVM